jgi:hypothetical protein
MLNIKRVGVMTLLLLLAMLVPSIPAFAQIDLTGIPPTPSADFVTRRVYRSAADSNGPFYLVGDLPSNAVTDLHDSTTDVALTSLPQLDTNELTGNYTYRITWSATTSTIPESRPSGPLGPITSRHLPLAPSPGVSSGRAQALLPLLWPTPNRLPLPTLLVTPMHRRTFDAAGKITNSHGDYPEAVRQAAKEENIPLIDLTAMSKDLYEALGPVRSGALFKDGDGTHHTNYGSYELAKCVVFCKNALA